MRFTAVCSALFLALAATTSFAQEEPWGGNVAGWRFTQASEQGGVNCRAINGPNLIARRHNGRTYVSMPVPSTLPKGMYREGRATIIMGAQAEPVDAEAQVARLLLHIDEGLYPAIIRARGFQWRVSGPKGLVSGTVSFSGDVAKAVAELRACVKANVAAAPKPAPKPAGNVMSLYTRSNGNLCLGAVAGMMNVGLVTHCSKKPSRIRVDNAAKRIRVGDQPDLCLSFAVGKFSEINDLLVTPCNRVTVDLSYDPASTQIRTKGDFCLGLDGAVQELTRLKMQPCSASATGQKWVLGNAVARP